MLASAPTAIRVLAVLFAVFMLGSSAFLFVQLRRARNPEEDWAVVYTLLGLRAGEGVAALWLGLGAGLVAVSCLGGFLLAHALFSEVIGRRA
jgi:hypothetical protein